MGKRLFFQIYPAFLLLIAVTIIPTAWFATGIFREFHIDSIREGVLHRAAILQPVLLEKINTPGFLKFCDQTAAASGARLTVIDAKGKVLYDSSSDYAHMPNHEERPELKNALDERKPAISMRYSSTLMKDMLYVAEPLIDTNGKAVGAFRLSLPLAAVDTSIGALKLKLFAFALILALAAMGIGLLISRRLSRPLEEVRRSVVRMADGDLDRHLSETGSIEEINALAASVNSLAVQLKLRIADITSRKNELSTILSSMSEGVIAVDPDLRMIIVNRSALEILNLKMDSVEGRTLYEVLRNPKMQNFVENLLSGHAPAEDEIEWDAKEKRRLVLRGSIMTDPDSDQPSGAVVVIRDVTRMRKLEEMRRDFVANVSHEIKTPVTAIKTAVETLSAEEDSFPPPLRKFLEIIGRHADRLSALVSDVLSLSALESNPSEQGMLFTFRKENLAGILKTAMELCASRAENAGVKLLLDCPENLEINADSSLLEQAVVNLVDNAVKYSPSGETVRITGAETGSRILIAVEDHGCGIPEGEHERIFERFYRVDKARSRKLGGTGLGLSIVKHIAIAHNGNVRLESAPGTGSTFIIELPRS